MAKKKDAMKGPETRAEMEHVVREACLASARLDEVVAQMNEAIAKAKAPFEAEIETLSATYEVMEAMAIDWAKSHPKEFATAKSVTFVHGVVGFRLGKPTLKPLKGVTWEKVREMVRVMLPAYVRKTEEVNREALVAARDEIGEMNMEMLGLKVVQTNRPYLTVDKTTITAGVGV